MRKYNHKKRRTGIIGNSTRYRNKWNKKRRYLSYCARRVPEIPFIVKSKESQII